MLVRKWRFGPNPKDPLLTIASRIEIDFETDCWNWTAGTGEGYGVFTQSRAETRRYSTRAHRSLYERVVEDVPPELHLDHLCRNRLCVNPDHLEPVTAAENNRRALGPMTHCRHGHAYDEPNTRFHKDGSRYCLACMRAKSKRQYQKRKARAAAGAAA